MKIVATEGCTAYGVDINDKVYNPKKYTKENLKEETEILSHLIPLINEDDERIWQFSCILSPICKVKGNNYVFDKYSIEVNEYGEPYKIEVDGNIIYPFTNKEFNNYLQDIIEKVCNNLDNYNEISIDNLGSNLRQIIWDLVVKYGESKYLYTCEQCGDSVYEYTIKY